MRVTHRDQVRVLLRELAASDGMLSLNDLLGEVRVLESPEAQKAWLKLRIISTVNVELSITDSY